ncbi:DUF3014 domain-containing protein [Methylomonas methanica]|uniref:DUF3014 domain-containing protein n=1 Tax=Methylomonas methanica (strain DSM 25384 / MC09) TaxID=857087 RepID=G0A5B5_METMM|nr:DUF3014 domain-containing protein [Methylomonas methanica]AEG01621.1 hypothetical protein Metme_3249 [Methylomonas methanica MC09]
MGRYDLTDDKKPGGVVPGLILLLIVAAGGWFYWQYSQEPPATPDTQILRLPDLSGVDSPATEGIGSAANSDDGLALDEAELPEQPFSLPALASSDQPFRDAMLGVSATLSPWLQTKQLIRKYLLIANDFSQGLWLEKHMRFLKQAEPFAVEKAGNGLYISKQSYQRYDQLAAAIDAMDVRAAAKVYRQFKPLLLEVFAEFGYPAERPLEDLFLKSAAQILAAPIIEQPIALKKHLVYYKYADAKLEALSPVARQMLRMGPDNTRIIQNKVRQLVEMLVNSKE